MKVVDIAAEIHRELASPSSLSIPAIAYWVRNNIGQLNNLINTSFFINSTTLEIEETNTDVNGTTTTTEIGIDEGGILKKLYIIHYYDLKIRANVVNLESDSIVSVSDDASSVTKVNRNQITFALTQLKKQEYFELTKLVHGYQRNNSGPIQIVGDDTEAGPSSTKYNTEFNRKW
tara:strand:+ start:1837 stop:2361 length:525 start_codon:yes stop_codon:yes gene_type:complete